MVPGLWNSRQWNYSWFGYRLFFINQFSDVLKISILILWFLSLPLFHQDPTSMSFQSQNKRQSLSSQSTDVSMYKAPNNLKLSICHLMSSSFPTQLGNQRKDTFNMQYLLSCLPFDDNKTPWIPLLSIIFWLQSRGSAESPWTQLLHFFTTWHHLESLSNFLN